LYKLLITDKLLKELTKLSKKDKVLYETVFKKADEICINPNHYKNLNSPLNKYKRVHVSTNFVLCFSVNEEEKTVTIVKLAHHDEAY
jgi:YafQ family addiction module toxin component